MDNIQKIIRDIKELKIQGATNIAKSVIVALGEYTKTKSWNYGDLKKKALELAYARPTEPLAQNCVALFLNEAQKKNTGSLEDVANKIIGELNSNKDKTTSNGIKVIKNNSTILTHCHSSAVISILKNAYLKGIKFKVYSTETRPLYQGHITAKELVDIGIDTTMITDSEAAFLISKEDNIKIDLVILGADAINANGDAVNKVGSFGASLSAKANNIPLYVVSSLLKFTLGLHIEKRSEDEIWRDKPENLKILNLAFDKIPAEYITYFITEKGLLKPSEISEAVRKYYPWIINESFYDR